jgi:hypothetical protein
MNADYAQRIQDPAFVLDMALKTWPASNKWYHRQAGEAVRAGHYELITGRQDRLLYLLRMWLSKPMVVARALPGGEYKTEFESEDSLLLHFFARGDADAAHDHPWWFNTDIIYGGYREYLPEHSWDRSTGLGPDITKLSYYRGEGDRVHHEPTDLHRVGQIVPGTITLVRTGLRVRDWGFFPRGKPWVPHADYLEHSHSQEKVAAHAKAYTDRRPRPKA